MNRLFCFRSTFPGTDHENSSHHFCITAPLRHFCAAGLFQSLMPSRPAWLKEGSKTTLAKLTVDQQASLRTSSRICSKRRRFLVHRLLVREDAQPGILVYNYLWFLATDAYILEQKTNKAASSQAHQKGIWGKTRQATWQFQPQVQANSIRWGPLGPS